VRETGRVLTTETEVALPPTADKGLLFKPSESFRGISIALTARIVIKQGKAGGKIGSTPMEVEDTGEDNCCFASSLITSILKVILIFPVCSPSKLDKTPVTYK
jgi:hypothetical protein